MYRPDCPDARGLHGFWCLSITGIIFTTCTYIGFALLVAGAILASQGASEKALDWPYSLDLKAMHAWRSSDPKDLIRCEMSCRLIWSSGVNLCARLRRFDLRAADCGRSGDPGVFWQVNLIPKLKASWSEIRQKRRAGRQAEAGLDAV